MDQENPYQSPQHASTEAASLSSGRHLRDDTKPSRWQRADLVLAITQQAVLLLLTALLLDGGATFGVCCIAAIAHWVAMIIMWIRRPSEPTTLDAAVVKFGFPFCFLLAYAGALALFTIGTFW